MVVAGAVFRGAVEPRLVRLVFGQAAVLAAGIGRRVATLPALPL